MRAKDYIMIMQNILHQVDEGVHVLDDKGNTIIYNESMSHLEKMDSKDVIKKPFKDVFKNLNQDNSTLLRALELKKSTYNKKQTYLNKDGKEITTIN
ncbi:MAG: AAA family ATPase, partial [Tissierellia bacterium]|nr:AAA family ATPase [Tissierellia bacterium]